MMNNLSPEMLKKLREAMKISTGSFFLNIIQKI